MAGAGPGGRRRVVAGLEGRAQGGRGRRPAEHSLDELVWLRIKLPEVLGREAAGPAVWGAPAASGGIDPRLRRALAIVVYIVIAVILRVILRQAFR